MSEADEIIRRTKMVVILLQGPSKNYERQLAYLDALLLALGAAIPKTQACGCKSGKISQRGHQPDIETLSASFRLAILSRKVRKNFDLSFSLTALIKVERRMIP